MKIAVPKPVFNLCVMAQPPRAATGRAMNLSKFNRISAVFEQRSGASCLKPVEALWISGGRELRSVKSFAVERAPFVSGLTERAAYPRHGTSRVITTCSTALMR
jgi:hypothetical protein